MLRGLTRITSGGPGTFTGQQQQHFRHYLCYLSPYSFSFAAQWTALRRQEHDLAPITKPSRGVLLRSNTPIICACQRPQKAPLQQLERPLDRPAAVVSAVSSARRRHGGANFAKKPITFWVRGSTEP